MPEVIRYVAGLYKKGFACPDKISKDVIGFGKGLLLGGFRRALVSVLQDVTRSS